MQPLIAGVPGLPTTWEGLLYGQAALLPYTQGHTYTFILGLVPAGTPPSKENVIPGCYWEGQVVVK